MKKKIILGVVIGLVFLGAVFTVLSEMSQYSLGGKESNKLSYSVSESPNFALDSSGRTEKITNLQGSSLPESSISPEPDSSPVLADKKIIKNGSLGLKVSSVDQAAEDVANVAKKNNGEVFSSNLRQSSTKLKSGTVTVKVPVEKFENTLSEIKKIAVLVLNESTSGNDISEQYVDLQARLKNKKAEEESFMKILGSAQKIDDILAVTRELSRTRGEIESLEGRIRWLDSQTDMSTITVNLAEDQEITFTDSWRPFQVMKDTVNGLLKDFQKFINFLIVLIIRVVPIFALYGIIAFLVYKLGRKIYAKFRAKKEDNSLE